MTIERLPQTICTPYRMPVPGKIMLSGIGAQPNRCQLIYAIASGTLRRFAFGLRFVCEICARSERLVSELCRAEAGRATTFPISFRLSFPRLCRHTVRTSANARIAKHALIRFGLADAGSAYRSPRRRGPPVKNQALTIRMSPHGSTLAWSL